MEIDMGRALTPAVRTSLSAAASISPASASAFSDSLRPSDFRMKSDGNVRLS